MPRVAQVPRASSASKRAGSRVTSGSLANSPFKSPMKIPLNDMPLNDDVQERAMRANSRQALQEAHVNKLKAASGTPLRKTSGTINDLESDSQDSPPQRQKTPRPRPPRDIISDDDDVIVSGTAVTPMKRVPILANFEEWMKMATDNKINATNSWNFALIDYFHDMSLLKEGDGVNFQKASCTLDGCVKIYTSRVDSVATETGKLLSGLADSRDSKKKRGEGEEGEGEGEESEEELDEDGNVRKKPKRKTQRSSEATLAPSFAALQLKKFELEFAVDPLFKKASADFDEGGAQGLLLNHLMIDAKGRIVFDSSDDTLDAPETKKKRKRSGEEDEEVDEDDEASEDESSESTLQVGAEADEEDDVEIDLTALGARVFPDLSHLDTLDVCPSLKTFDLGDPSGSLDIPFLRAPEDWRQEQETAQDGAGNRTGMELDDDNVLGFDDGEGLGDFSIGGDVAFGEGGEAWAKEAALEPQMRVFNAGSDDLVEAAGDELRDNAEGGDEFNVSMMHAQKPDKMHEDILAYFDQALQKNWSSAEHWRIRKIKDVNKPVQTKQRKEKEPFEIDFAAPMDKALAEVLYTQASSNTVISLPKKDWKSKTRNKLPDDKHFNSKQLLSLFLKPKARMIRRRGFGRRGVFGSADDHQNHPEGEMDEAFWAAQKAPMQSIEDRDENLAQGDYDANFFQDDGLPFAGGLDDDDDIDEFADARDHFSPGADAGAMETIGATGAFNGLTVTNPADLAFGTMLVTQNRRVRPEYVNYARVAKKVDIRRLKDEIWKGMDLEKLDSVPPPTPQVDGANEAPPPSSENNPTLKFTTVINDLQKVYPKPVMDDISTSYCFISLLHLANEKGLVIENTEGLTDLHIRKDWTAVITEGDA